MPHSFLRTCAINLSLGAFLAAPAVAVDGFYRTPDLHDDTVVFAAEGDLWTVTTAGGTARRLTTHVGNEYFPRFSPDGNRVAFSAQYDGNNDVFVVDTAGGEPRRLTWHPGRDEVVGWTPGGDRVLFRSSRAHPHGDWEMYTVALDGGNPEPMNLGRVARLSIDPGTGAYALCRTDRERSTWKRYRGGTAPDIWIGHPGKDDFRAITEFDGMDMMPMWREGRVWFLSDLGGTLNLWSILPDGTDRRSHTERLDWDMRWPEMGPDGRIVYQLGADIRLFDPETSGDTAIDIDLPSERVLTRRRYPDAGRYLTWFDLSAEGDRLAVVARGEVFSVPVEDGITLPVSRGSGARESWAVFDPSGITGIGCSSTRYRALVSGPMGRFMVSK